MKKNLIIILGAIAFSNVSLAQTIDYSNVPTPITTAFNSTFSNMENVNWEMDYENYIAKFKKNKVEVAVTYNKDGKWISTETPITYSSLPPEVKESLTKEFEVYKENDVEKIESREGVNYLIDLEYNQMNYEVLISSKGELLKREQVK